MLPSSPLNKITSWGIYSPYCYVLIIRGIGYRAFILNNDFINSSKQQTTLYSSKTSNLLINGTHIKKEYEFVFSSYLVIRAGHTIDLYIGLPKKVLCYIIKKDRKLVLISPNKVDIGYLAKKISSYRTPSVYTGRGLRTKGIAVLRKAGKKDKQKGKAF